MAVPHLRHRTRAALAAVSVLLSLSMAGRCAPAEAIDEYAIKGAMLLNIARLVDWPAAKASDSFVIGIVAPPAVGADIEAVIKDKAVGKKTVTVRRLASLAAAADCHLIFIAGTDRKPAERDVAALAKAGVLTVGESDGFAVGGGVVGLVVKDKRLQMEINLKAAHRSGLSISSRILRLATIVEGGA